MTDIVYEYRGVKMRTTDEYLRDARSQGVDLFAFVNAYVDLELRRMGVESSNFSVMARIEKALNADSLVTQVVIARR